MRAKCFDITRRAVDAIAQHQPALIRCDALSTASLHHYLYKCRVLAAQKKWRSARNGAANVLHARMRRHVSSVVSLALEPTACSSARLELPPEVVSGSVLVASAQFVGARCFDVAAPRFEARPSRRRRRKDDPLHTLALLGVDPAECAARTYRVLTLNRRTSAMLTNSLASHV